MTYTDQHIRRALIAQEHGAEFIVAIIRSCVKYDLPLSAGFALVEKETGFRNVWGHDPMTKFQGFHDGLKYAGGIDGVEGKEVTKARYQKYLKEREKYGYQGVGPLQLTWGPTQDVADKRGGAWNPAANIDVGIETLARNLKTNLKRGMNEDVAMQLAAQAYNGSGEKAVKYGKDFMVLYDKWYNRLK